MSVNSSPTTASTASTFQMDRLRQSLGVAACRFDVDALAETSSTNTLLLARAEAGAPSGSVIIADCQTAGRGRLGRSWLAAPGDSLTFSLLWRFRDDGPLPVGLSLAIGLGLLKGLNSLGLRGLGLKWPNDLLCNGRKLAGVLVELQAGRLRSAVIGIGLNLALPPEMPETLRQSSTALDAQGYHGGRELALAAILSGLMHALDTFAQAGFAALREEWMAHHAYQGQWVGISGGAQNQQGICLGVDAEGGLLLQTDQGVSTVISGDVSLRPLS